MAHSLFWDMFAKLYSSRRITNESNYRKKLDITRSYLRPEMTLLEFGCGTGNTALVHAAFVRKIDGIDYSSRMIDIALDNAKMNDATNVHFSCVAIEDLEAPPESYDMVLGLNILHLLEDKEAALAHVYTLLKPGGIFVSSTVCVSKNNLRLTILFKVAQILGLMPRKSNFSVDHLVKCIESLGFDIDYKWLPDDSESLFLVAKKGTD